jgi:hypothetical protein
VSHFQYPKNTHCPVTGCTVKGSLPGIKRHLKKTHKVSPDEFPVLSDPRTIKASKAETKTNMAKLLESVSTEELWKELGKRLGLA